MKNNQKLYNKVLVNLSNYANEKIFKFFVEDVTTFFEAHTEQNIKTIKDEFNNFVQLYNSSDDLLEIVKAHDKLGNTFETLLGSLNVSDIDNEFYQHTLDIHRDIDKYFLKTVAPYHRFSDFNYLNNRVHLLIRNLVDNFDNNFKILSSDYLEDFNSYAKEVYCLMCDYSKHLRTVVDNHNINVDYKLEKHQTSLETLSKKEKIFSYKSLNKLAKDYGYMFDRQKGSHAQFKHTNTGKLVTIPQGRDSGKGLSYKIQKDIKVN